MDSGGGESAYIRLSPQGSPYLILIGDQRGKGAERDFAAREEFSSRFCQATISKEFRVEGGGLSSCALLNGTPIRGLQQETAIY